MSGAQAVRRVRRLLAGRGAGSERPFAEQRRICDAARVLVRVFYAVNLFLIFHTPRQWPEWRETAAIDPLWPIAWIRLTGIGPGVDVIMLLVLAGAFAAAFLPGSRAARLLAFVGLLVYHAFGNSFGKINHASHGWILAGFLLIFLPDAGRAELARSRLLRQRYLNAFWSAQAMLLVCYTMSGAAKAVAVIPQVLRGEVHGLAPSALAMHIAHRLLQTSDESLLGPFFIEHPWLGWPPFVFTLYLQVFAIAAAFRPGLHRPWAAGLLLFHFMVYLTMTVSFGAQVLVVCILLLASPFDPACGWRRRVEALPLWGAVESGYRWIGDRLRAEPVRGYRT